MNITLLHKSRRGITCPVILPSADNVTDELYREKCLNGILLQFIESECSDHDVLFLPDLLTAHYERQATKLLEEAEVPIVAR